MEVINTDIEEVKIIIPRAFEDERGHFFESFSQSEFTKRVAQTVFIQDNHSYSKAGVLRGLHYQISPSAQAKLIRVVSGRVWDVAVDLRQGAETFGKWVAVELSAQNRAQIFIPKGFAHGFLALENSELAYKVDHGYSPDRERTIIYNDMDLAIDWEGVNRVRFGESGVFMASSKMERARSEKGVLPGQKPHFAGKITLSKRDATAKGFTDAQKFA